MTKLVKIVWDEPNRVANLEARGLDFATATFAFFEEAQILPAEQGRYLAIGRIDGRPRALIFKPAWDRGGFDHQLADGMSRKGGSYEEADLIRQDEGGRALRPIDREVAA